MRAFCGYREADAYRRFAEVLGPVLTQASVEAVRKEAAEALARFLPYDAFDLRVADAERRELVPVLARGPRAAVVMRTGRISYGLGLSGWIAAHQEPLLANDAFLDPRTILVSGTPPTPEAVMGVPLVVRGRLKNVLLVRRFGPVATFSDSELALTRCFADLVAIALDNADARATLEEQATTDPLTGLPNRRRFTEELIRQAAAAEQNGEQLSVLLIDVDGLKLTNDTLGHHEGDRLLMAVAEKLKSELREGDLAGRIAGDEFGVLLRQTDSAQASVIARRLADAITTHAERTWRLSGVGASVGWAEFAVDGRDPEELLQAADRSMYTVKRQHHSRTRSNLGHL